MTASTETAGPLPDGWGMVIGLEVHCELHTGHQAVLLLSEQLR